LITTIVHISHVKPKSCLAQTEIHALFFYPPSFSFGMTSIAAIVHRVLNQMHTSSAPLACDIGPVEHSWRRDRMIVAQAMLSHGLRKVTGPCGHRCWQRANKRSETFGYNCVAVLIGIGEAVDFVGPAWERRMRHFRSTTPRPQPSRKSRARRLAPTDQTSSVYLAHQLNPLAASFAIGFREPPAQMPARKDCNTERKCCILGSRRNLLS